MANIPLKSIKFPGLSNTYTVPQLDDTLAVPGAAADAKAVGDAINSAVGEITDLKDDLSQIETAVQKIENMESSMVQIALTPFVQGTISGTTGEIETEDTTKCHIGKISYSDGDSLTYNRKNSYMTASTVLFLYDLHGNFLTYETLFNGTTRTFSGSGMFAIRGGTNNGGTTQQMIDCANQSFVLTTTAQTKIVSAVSGMTSATASDVGKTLSPKTVEDGEVTGWQFIPAAEINDMSGSGDTNKTWSANKLSALSGEIEDAVDSIDSAFSHVLQDWIDGWEDVTYVNTGFINSTGAFVEYGTNVFYSTDFIAVSKNDFIEYKMYGSGSAVYIVNLYDSNQALVSNIIGESAFKTGSLTVPSGVAYVRFSCQRGTPLSTFSIKKYTALTGDQTVQALQNYTNIVSESITLTMADVNVIENSIYKSTGIATNFVNGRRTDYIPVSEGDTINYRLWNYVPAPTYQYAVAVFDSSYTLVDHVAGTSEENGYVSGTYTVPSGAAYVMLSWNYDLIKTGWFEINVATLTEKITDYIDRVRNTPTSPLKGKQWCCMGDSLTNGASTVEPYHMWITRRTGITAYNFGMSSTAITKDTASITHNMATRYLEMFDDVDYVTVFGGTNDHGRSLPIGEWEDADELTLYGAMKILCEGLINKYIGKKIGFILPCPKCTTKDNVTTDYSYPSESMVPYIECIKNVCARYSIPVLDLYTQSDMHPSIAAFRTAMMPDGLHPNSDGQELLSYRIQSFLESL